jgi:hypothetical protein
MLFKHLSKVVIRLKTATMIVTKGEAIGGLIVTCFLPSCINGLIIVRKLPINRS